MEIRALSGEDARGLTVLASEPDVVRFGDHLAEDSVSRWEEWIGEADPQRQLVLGAFGEHGLEAAAKVAFARHRRRVHTAFLTLVVSEEESADGALDALLARITDACERWLHVLRLELVCPADHPRVSTMFAAHGFVVELRRAKSLSTDGALVDEAACARIRAGVVVPGAEPPLASSAAIGDPVTVEIREATERDGEATSALMSEPSVIWGTLQLPHQRADVWGPRFAANDPDRFFVFAAEHEGELAGIGSLILPEPARRRHVGSLGMSVASRYQGRGVGSQLMAHLMRVAEERALPRVELGVYHDNARAVRLYERAGFVVEGRQRMFALRDGTFVDDLHMAKVGWATKYVDR